MKKVFWKKLATTLTAVFAVALMFVAVYGIGFQYPNLEGTGKIDLDELKKMADSGVDLMRISEIASTTYNLLLAGIILSALAAALLAVSTIFGRLLFAFDWIIWGGGVFMLLLGVVLVIAGEGYFADNWFGFKDNFDQGMLAAMIICSLLPGLIGVGLGAVSFQKKK